MFSFLRRLSEKSPLARVLSAARPARRFLQLGLVALAAHIPLACVLAVGVLGERRVNARDSLITRCSPRTEALWTVFVAVCGLLATATNVYCIDQLTSTPAARASRAWPRWLRRTHPPVRPQNSCGGSPGVEMPTIRPAPAPDEPLSPADGFSPHTHGERPPTYQQATAVPLHTAHPTLVHIHGPASPRPRMVRRQAASQVPTQRLLHRLTAGPPHWSTRSTALLLLWILALSTLFLACTAPLIASSAVQPLVRDAAYAHACDGFEWEVLLHARRGSPATAEFTARTSPRSFTMQLQPQRGGYALGAAVSYETATHAYRGLVAGVPLHGTYNVTGERQFPELGLRGGGRKDYFGFPRVVMEREKGAVVVVTTRVKRGSCEDVKVCVRGVKPAVAVVVVGPLLVETVEAAGKCRGG